jgi:hypothetical protein
MIISQVKLIDNKCRLATYNKHASYLNQHLLVIINLRLPSSHIKHNYKSHMNIGEMTLLWNDCNKQVSLISRGFMEIRINLHLASEKPDNTTHMSYKGTTGSHSSRQRSKSRVGSHLSLVHVFHMIPHARISVGGPYTILVYIAIREVRDHPTR